MDVTTKVLTAVLCLAVVATAAGETVRWVPAAASNDGENGTRWTTTLWVQSMAEDGPITVYAAFLAGQEGDPSPTEVAIECPPTQPVEVEDAVAALFGESRPGAIRLRSAHPFEARSRTFNQGGEGGTFGQGIPAVGPEDALAFGSLVGVANIPGDDGVRSNLGILNPGDQAAHVLVLVLKNAMDGELEYARSKTLDVGPHGWLQSNIFSLVGDQDATVENAWAVVSGDMDPVDPETPLVFYLSRIDNRSGDATYIEPFLNLKYALEPGSVEVHYSVSTTEAFSLYSVTYPGADNEPIAILEPPGDWSVDVETALNQILCLEAIGDVTSDGGSVEACVQPGDDTPTCRSCEGEAGTLCRVETCVFVY